MKYFYDAEFLEGKQRKTILGIPFGKTKPTIDLISIGIVCEDGREYYAISKDFNLKEAWNRYDVEIQTFSGDLRNQYPNGRKQKKYWIRENVLKSVFNDLLSLYEDEYSRTINTKKFVGTITKKDFSYKLFKWLLNRYGKSNKQIALEIQEFVYGFAIKDYPQENTEKIVPKDIQFYGYYSAYDHVVLCWLFGNMIDLPKGFPMFTIDLKQLSDSSYAEAKRRYYNNPINEGKSFISELKLHPIYPKQSNEHNALADAKWNKDLFNFLEKIEYGTIIR